MNVEVNEELEALNAIYGDNFKFKKVESVWKVSHMCFWLLIGYVIWITLLIFIGSTAFNGVYNTIGTFNWRFKI